MRILLILAAALIFTGCPDDTPMEPDEDASVPRDATPHPDATETPDAGFEPDATPDPDAAPDPDAMTRDIGFVPHSNCTTPELFTDFGRPVSLALLRRGAHVALVSRLFSGGSGVRFGDGTTFGPDFELVANIRSQSIQDQEVAMTDDGEVGAIGVRTAQQAVRRALLPDGTAGDEEVTAIPAVGGFIGAIAAGGGTLFHAYPPSNNRGLLYVHASTTAWSDPEMLDFPLVSVTETAIAINSNGDGAILMGDNRHVYAKMVRANVPVGRVATATVGMQAASLDIRPIAFGDGSVYVLVVTGSNRFAEVEFSYDAAGDRAVATTPMDLETSGVSGFVDLAGTDRDNLTIAWVANSITVARRKTSAGWQPRQELGATNGTSLPSVAMDDAGNAAVVYGVPIHLREAPRDAPDFGEEIAVPVAGAGVEPQVVFHPNGSLLVAYRAAMQIDLVRCE